MEVNGRFACRTLNNHSIDACKSAMQKYARRGNFEKMYYAALELDAFRAFDTMDKRKLATIKAIRTNMINRLKVILFEDVSFKSGHVFANATRLIEKWTETRQLDSYTTRSLRTLCHILATAKKARQPSYLRFRYGHCANVVSFDTFENELTRAEYTDSFAWIYQNERDAAKYLANKLDEFHADAHPCVQLALKEWKRLCPSKRDSDRLVFLCVPFLWLKFKVINFKESVKSVKEITFTEHTFDDFVYDVHTFKGKAMGKDVALFRSEGAYVTNQDESAIDFEMKEAYESQTPASNIDDFDNLSNIKLIIDGVCGRKPPCFFATKNGEKYVFKPMPKSQRYGKDYAYIDAQKKLFGLNAVNVRLIELSKSVKRLDSKEYIFVPGVSTYAQMSVVDSIGDLGKLRSILEDERLYEEMLKIRLFDGLFLSSDNILRNILVSKSHEFFSIDENDAFGKRKMIFNKKEPIKRSKYFTREKIEQVLADMNVLAKIDALVDNLKPFDLAHLADRLRERLINYTEIVYSELDYKT
jgi:hypothetical protein